MEAVAARTRPSRARRAELRRAVPALRLPLDETPTQCRALPRLDREAVRGRGRPALPRAVGVGLDEARRWDVARLFRAPQWDPQFPGRSGCSRRSRRRSPGSASTCAAGEHPPRRRGAAASRARAPSARRSRCRDRVMLVIKPMGGADDWRALFHEAGHAEHFAHTSRDLPMEERRLGDNAVTEGWAMLLEHLVDDPAWLDAAPGHPAAATSSPPRARQAALLRAPLLREAPVRARAARVGRRGRGAPRYVELLGDA